VKSPEVVHGHRFEITVVHVYTSNGRSPCSAEWAFAAHRRHRHRPR
jgi:hypothetical protein